MISLESCEVNRIVDETWGDPQKKEYIIGSTRKIAKRNCISISNDEAIEIGLNALWRAAQKHDASYGTQFTSSIYQFICYEVLDLKRKRGKERRFPSLEFDVSQGGPPKKLESREVLSEALKSLHEYDRKLLVKRFFQGQTLTSIAEDVGSTRQKISKCISEAKIHAQSRFAKTYKSRYHSESVSASHLLAERMCERVAKRKKLKLSTRFWAHSPWSQRFEDEKEHARKLLKKYSLSKIVSVMRNEGRGVLSLQEEKLKGLFYHG